MILPLLEACPKHPFCNYFQHRRRRCVMMSNQIEADIFQCRFGFTESQKLQEKSWRLAGGPCLPGEIE